MRNTDEILKKVRVPPALIVEPDEPTGWMLPYQTAAAELCKLNRKPVAAHFTFIEDTRMQAFAIQDDREIVGVYAGMFWLLCRLASRAAGSSVFPVLRGAGPQERPLSVEKSRETPRTLLKERQPFNWIIESASWRENPERQALFHTLLTSLLRFVTCHEVGHLAHDHGARKRNGDAGVLPMLVDPIGAMDVKATDAVASQAREIIADSFALDYTIEVLRLELKQKAGMETAQLLRAKLFPDLESIASFVLLIAFVYFRVSDRSDWREIPLDRMSHPPAPFRARAVSAAFLELSGHHGFTRRIIGDALRRAESESDALICAILGTAPNPGWIQSVSTPEHDTHFERLRDEVPRWVNAIDKIDCV